MYCDQSCTFEYRHWTTKGVGGLYYTCTISNTTITSEPVTTKTSNNRNSNQKVTAVQYSAGSDLKFIPNSLFITFTSLQFFIMAFVNLKSLKQDFFKNANNLKGIQINGNPFTFLEENLFVKAPRLEGINLGGNEITFIHKLAFNGLLKLQWIELHSNKITSLSPWTFTSLSNLQFLKLVGNECINQNFQNPREIMDVLESEIKKSCVHQVDIDQHFMGNLAELVVKLTTQNEQIQARINKMEEKSITDNKNMNEIIENMYKKYEDRIKKLEDDFATKAALTKNLTIVEEAPLSKYISSVQENSPVVLEKFNKKFEECEANYQKIENITLKKFESFTKLFHQGSHIFETRIKGLEEKILRSNTTEMKRKLNGFIDQVQTKFDNIDEKAFKDSKILDKLSMRLEPRTKDTVNFISFDESMNKMEENLNKRADKISQDMIKSIDAKFKPQISAFKKELELLAQKINISAQSCKADLVRVEKKVSDNFEVIVKLGQRISSSSSNFETAIKSLESKFETGFQRHLSNFRIINGKLKKLTQDLQGTKTEFIKKRD